MRDDMIPVANPLAQYQACREEIDAVLERVLEGGHYILGPEVSAFEEEFAAYNGVITFPFSSDERAFHEQVGRNHLRLLR